MEFCGKTLFNVKDISINFKKVLLDIDTIFEKLLLYAKRTILSFPKRKSNLCVSDGGDILDEKYKSFD